MQHRRLLKAAILGLNLNPSRSVSVSATLLKTHYEALDVSVGATQAEIKAAYYNLSKLYHPDINKDSKSAAEKFREVTEAYEVLGNFRLRKLYDRGILHQAGAQFADQMPPEEPVEEDPQTRFYKQRLKRSEAPAESGTTTVHDFDAWAKEQNTRSFERRQSAKTQYDQKVALDARSKEAFKTEQVIMGLLALVIVIVGVHMASNSAPPRPVPKNR